jgi:hypothetical protein
MMPKDFVIHFCIQENMPSVVFSREKGSTPVYYYVQHGQNQLEIIPLTLMTRLITFFIIQV